MNRHGSIGQRLRDDASRGMHTPPRSITAQVMARIEGSPAESTAARTTPWRLGLSTLGLAAAIVLVAWLGGPVGAPPPSGQPGGLTPIAYHRPPLHRSWWMSSPVYWPFTPRRPAWAAFDAGYSVASALRSVADAECPLEQEAQLLADDAREATRRVLASLRVAVR